MTLTEYYDRMLDELARERRKRKPDCPMTWCGRKWRSSATSSASGGRTAREIRHRRSSDVANPGLLEGPTHDGSI